MAYSNAEILYTVEESEFRSDFRKDLADGTMIRNLPLHCTVCEVHIEHQLVTYRNFHLFLGVLVCNACHEVFENGFRSADLAGRNFLCLWCAKRAPRRYSEHIAEKRSFIKCCNCSRQFCKDCIKRHAPETLYTDENGELQKWTCFKCDSKPLWSLRALCDLACTWKWFADKKRAEEIENQRDVAATEELKMCVICFERQALIAFYPCGHLPLCETCLPDYKKHFTTCPICMQTFRDAMRVYLEK